MVNTMESLHGSSRCVQIEFCKDPRDNYLETEAFKRISSGISSVNVYHIYGFPGNGKTQICRAISRKKKSHGSHIIWNVQCSVDKAEGESILKKEWKRLVGQLVHEELVDNKNKTKIVDELDHDDGKSFVRALESSNIPVFLVVEDVSDKERELVKSVVHCLINSKQPVQLLIATPKKDDVFPEQDISKMDRYWTYEVTGFTEEEAIEFLSENCKNEDAEAVADLAKCLCFSPLHLTLAKAYCMEHKESYLNYRKSLGKNPDIIEREKEFLKKHPDVGKAHAYEVIMKLLTPKDDSKVEKKMFEVIKFLALLEHEDIPDFLLGRYYRQLYEADNEGERNFVKHLITKLRKDRIFTVRDKESKYGEGLQSTHKVILFAIEMSMSVEEKKKVVETGLKAFSSLATKDNRLTTANVMLSKMMTHVDSFVGKSGDLLDLNFDIKDVRFQDFEIQIGLSRVYEVLCFINAQQGINEDGNIGKALSLLWKVACRYEKRYWMGLCKSVIDRHDLFQYHVGKRPREVAEKAVEAVKHALDKIPVEFVERHYSTFFSVNLQSLNDMQRSDKAKQHDIDWGAMESTLKKDGRLSDDQIEVLRDNQFLLTPEQLHKTFLLERIASILHTRSRLLLYLQDSIDEAEQKKYEWYREVGIHISLKIPEFGGIHSLFEYILDANNKLARLVHNRKDESDKDFLKRLEEARQLAEKLSRVVDVFYENGIFKNVSGTPFTLLNIMKYIVKANTKIFKRPELAGSIMTDEKQKEATKACDELYEMAKRHSNINVAANCRVQAGKFYAAVGLFNKAVEAIDSGFKHNENGINKLLESRTKTYAWALHNYGMAICRGGASISNIDDHTGRFEKRLLSVEEQEKLDDDWREKLEVCQKDIKQQEWYSTRGY